MKTKTIKLSSNVRIEKERRPAGSILVGVDSLLADQLIALGKADEYKPKNGDKVIQIGQPEVAAVTQKETATVKRGKPKGKK